MCVVIVIAVYCNLVHMFISENELYKMFGKERPLRKALEGDWTNVFPLAFRAGQSASSWLGNSARLPIGGRSDA